MPGLRLRTISWAIGRTTIRAEKSAFQVSISNNAEIYKASPGTKMNTTTPSRNIKEVSGVLAHPDDLRVTNLCNVVMKMIHWQNPTPMLNKCEAIFQI